MLGKLKMAVVVTVIAALLMGGAVLADDGQPEWAQGVDKLTYYNAGALEYDPAIVETAIAFEAKYGIEVELVGIPEKDYVSKAARMLATGDATYDVFDMYLAMPMPSWAENGWVAPVDDVISDHRASKYPEGIWKAAEVDGKHYFVPHMVQPQLLVWNKKLFKEAGLDPNKPPKNWDQLVEYAKKLTVDKNDDGNIDQWGFVYPAGKIERAPILNFGYFLGMNGGRFWNEDGSPAFNDEKGVEALQFMCDLIYKHEVTPESVSNYNTGSVSDIFAEGSAGMAMFHTGHPIVHSIELLGKENIGGMAPPPATDDTDIGYPLGFVGPTQYVNAHSEHLEAAKHLAAFYGSYRSSWNETAVEGNVGVHMDIWKSPYIQNNFPFADAHREVVDKSFVPIHKGIFKAMTVFREGLQSALTQGKTPEEALNWIADELEKRGVL